MDHITITRLARNLADIVNRVAYRGERFLVLRGNRPVVELVPPPRGRRLADLERVLSSLPHLGPVDAERFAAELDEAREAAGSTGEGPWPS